MAVRFIRQPSDTPNITNLDDIRLFRYAVGGYDGYIKGKGAELDYTIDGTKFKINSGVGVVQGVDFEVDANGWELDVGSTPTRRYFAIYVEINLAAQTADIKSMYDTAGYPTVTAGDDLTASPTGTAMLLLYTFTAQSGVISEVSKKVTEIKYSKTLIAEEATARATEDANIRNDLMSGSLVAKIAQYASSDTSKGTIDSRLTAISGALTSWHIGLSNVRSYILKIGNLATINLSGYVSAESGITITQIVAKIPAGFRPMTDIIICGGVIMDINASSQPLRLLLSANGEIRPSGGTMNRNRAFTFTASYITA